MEPQPQGRATLAPRVGLAAILIVYGALASVQSFATRLQWGPDEPAHIIYVQSLALDGRFPELAYSVQDNVYVPGASRSHQAQHPPLYYMLAAPVWRAFSARPVQTVSYVDKRSAESHRFSVPGAVRPVRLVSVVLGAVTLLFAWWTARTVFPGRPVVWLGSAALTAFTPMFTYMSSVINNDALLGVVFAATAWRWARAVRFGAGARDLAILGVLLGIGLNVKETALGLAAVSVVVLGIEPGARSLGQRVARTALVLGLTAGLGGWWFVRKWLVYGSPFVYPFHYPLLGLPEPERFALMCAMPARILMSTFVPIDVVMGYANMHLVYGFFAGLVVLSAVGVGAVLVRRERHGVARYEAQSLVLWLLAGAVVLGGLLRNLLFVDWRMGTSGGRLLVCVLPLAAMASARGIGVLLGDGKWTSVGLAAICVLMLGVNVYAIWATAAQYGTLGW